MTAGYKESFEKTEAIGPDEVNEYKIFIKFFCTPESDEEVEKQETKLEV